ncbi:polysaccharide deacetylase [Pseudoxanthomonas broegbernensis]|uniref:Polysaccharide deacetylase n=1 Tax=Pseudoxanthomonas broegbernensis TaxID=83619 RepID=A0A7V8GP34_9GAMM|nr:polysaccharide deacetylase family protein [Pseudoxanthomonas broegbernensis]KAF1687362.1 polysaccharide deacetylase [Pseudoxanthomonas broegbernensis]MBB6065635.1 peptidoglycan/xylan/chitin deacetylase (PgdA/CDA1 family) [Pseudoxanthomonas broegbernensis]
MGIRRRPQGPCLLLLLACTWTLQAQDFAWPGTAKAAVSLAYDDALDSQLDNAVPALDRHGFKATFYLTPGRGNLPGRAQEWRAVAGHGHELGNHTLFHQCDGSRPGRDWVEAHRDLSTTTAAQMQDQVRAANAFLQVLDGRTERTFTAPCGDRGASDGEYVDGVRELFAGMKVSQGAHAARSMADFDRYAVPIEAPEGVTGAQLIARVEAAARSGTVAAFTFHGIGGDYMSVSAQAHEELLDYLDRHRDVYWTATFLDIARWVRDREASATP